MEQEEERMTLTKLITKNCDFCNNTFTKRRRIDGKNKHSFCGKICQGKYYSQSPRLGEFYPCYTCDKKVYRTKGRLRSKNNKHIFCSQACNYKYRKGKIISPTQFLFKKGRTPWNAGRKWEDMYGKEKSIKLKNMQSDKKKEEWKNLEYREMQMKFRTPEKLQKFRKKGEIYRKSKENIERLKKIHHKKVINKVLNGNY